MTSPDSHSDASPAGEAQSPWRRIVRDTAWVSGSTLVGQAFGAVTSLLLRVLLDPAQIGLWQGVRLMVNYGNLSNLGVSRGASREMTIALGRGDEPAARQAANLAFTVNTIASLVCGGGFAACGLALALCASTGSGRAWGAALVVAGLLCVAQRFLTYQVTVLRAHQHFSVTARITVLEAALTLGICGALSAIWGLTGLYVGSLVVGLLCAAYVVACGGPRLRLAWDGREMRRLLSVGFPILLAALANQLFRSLDRLAILALLPDREMQLGLYSVALLATGQMFGLANALATVMGPRYGETLGRTGQTSGVAALAAVATGPQTAMLALIGAMAIVLGGPLLAVVLPEYRAGLVALPWLVCGTVALGVALPASQYLITVDRQARLLHIVLASVGIGAILNILALVNGGGIAALAVATCLGQVCYAALVVRGSVWVELSSEQQRQYFQRVVIPAVVVLGTALAMAVDPSAASSWWSVGWRLLFTLFVGAAILALTYRPRGNEQLELPEATAQWRDRCYKPDAEHLGNAYVRYVVRPLALEVTRRVVPWGATAHQATATALAMALIAAGSLAWGTPGAVLLGAAALQLWYLLDHVDGQLARYHGTASLDGVQLDYLMHHLVVLAVPIGLGWGAFRANAEPVWMAAGLMLGFALLCQGLWHDARYKAFVQRLKWVRGELAVQGAGGGAAVPAAPWPRELRRLPGYLARKLCESHVLVVSVSLLALVGWLLADGQLLLVRGYLAGMAPLAAGVAIAVVVRDVRRGAAEREFAAWYQPPAGSTLQRDGGYWRVDPARDAPQPRQGGARNSRQPR